MLWLHSVLLNSERINEKFHMYRFTPVSPNATRKFARPGCSLPKLNASSGLFKQKIASRFKIPGPETFPRALLVQSPFDRFYFTKLTLITPSPISKNIPAGNCESSAIPTHAKTFQLQLLPGSPAESLIPFKSAAGGRN